MGSRRSVFVGDSLEEPLFVSRFEVFREGLLLNRTQSVHGRFRKRVRLGSNERMIE